MSENKKKKKDKVVAALNFGNGLVSFGAALLAIVLILYSGYVLYDSMAIEVSAFSSNSDLLKYKPSVLAQASDDGSSLAEINEDYRGWVTVDGDPTGITWITGRCSDRWTSSGTRTISIPIRRRRSRGRTMPSMT